MVVPGAKTPELRAPQSRAVETKEKEIHEVKPTDLTSTSICRAGRMCDLRVQGGSRLIEWQVLSVMWASMHIR